MIDGQRIVDREVNRTTATFNRITQAVKLYAAALVLVKAASFADDMRLLAARVEVAAGSVQAGAEAMRALEAISRRTQTSIAANANTFNRLNQSLIQMGGTQKDTLRLTELLAKAIKNSGASAAESSSAMLQFGQALGSGKLAGDELRSLMENAPYLMRQLADGLGVPIGALKKLGEEGKLTADVVVNALGKAAAQIESDFQKFPQTVGSALDVAQDAAMRANEAFDTMTGTSAVMTGALKGAGTVLDQLAQQFSGATDETDRLGRNKAIETWSDRTVIALSYVADAADVAWQTISVLGRNVYFVLETLGSQVGGIAAMAAAAARGEFAQAKAIWNDMKADDDARSREREAKDKETLRDRLLAGQKIRQAMAANAMAPGADRLDRAAAGGGALSKLRSGGGGGGGGKTTKPTKDFFNDAQDELEERLRRQYDQIADSEIEAIKAAQKKVDDEKAKAQADAMNYAAQLTGAINPIDALRQEYEAKLGLVRQYEQLMAQAGVDATEQGLIARTQIEREYDLQRIALAEQSFRSQSDANAFLIDSINSLSTSAAGAIVGLVNGTMTASDVMRSFANVILTEAVGALVQVGVQQVKNALLGDTIAAADKAKKAANGAVYAASVGAQVAGMTALAAQNAFAATAAIPIIGPGLAPAAAAGAAAAAAALGAPAVATAPIAGARQYGGPTAAGGMYRVNEGGRPEMFQAANGSQYMMANTAGKVIPASQIGNGGGWTININEAPAGTTASVNHEARIIDIAVGRAKAEIADEIGSNSGRTWTALRSATNVQGRMS